MNRYLRAFTWAKAAPCPGAAGLGHVGVQAAGQGNARWGKWVNEKLVGAQQDDPRRVLVSGPLTQFSDKRWPTACDACGESLAGAERIIDVREVYADVDGVEHELSFLPVGAMYDAWWLPPAYRGADDIALTVVIPDGAHWHVDGRGANCTLDRAHRCWCRHGDPRTEPVTVDKACPDTCTAGAGSIETPKWHGYLTGGVLTTI